MAQKISYCYVVPGLIFPFINEVYFVKTPRFREEGIGISPSDYHAGSFLLIEIAKKIGVSGNGFLLSDYLN